MKPRYFVVVGALVAALANAGCGSDSEPVRETPAQLLIESQHSVSAPLDAVDLKKKTFTLRVDHGPEEFVFTHATLISGGAGARGLAGHEGGRVTVEYHEARNQRIATRIVYE
jgi:hypothetical protein